MPTIEIISIDTDKLDLNQEDFEVAIIEEYKLISHRGLYNDFLLKFKGTIIHIGNPEFRYNKDGGFFGGDLINWDFGHKNNFKFDEKNKSEIIRLLNLSYDKSRTNQTIFLTDIQAENPIPRFKRFAAIKELINHHDKDGLDWNTLYMINFNNIMNSLYSEVDWILWNDWDPIGINDYGGPNDEYRGYVPETYRLLKENKIDIEIANHLERIVIERIGLNSNFEESLRIARLLIKAKQNYK